jgi:hypothetical protein
MTVVSAQYPAALLSNSRRMINRRRIPSHTATTDPSHRKRRLRRAIAVVDAAVFGRMAEVAVATVDAGAARLTDRADARARSTDDSAVAGGGAGVGGCGRAVLAASTGQIARAVRIDAASVVGTSVLARGGRDLFAASIQAGGAVTILQASGQSAPLPTGRGDARSTGPMRLGTRCAAWPMCSSHGATRDRPAMRL